MLIRQDTLSYTKMMDGFQWTIPGKLNIAHEICDRHALSTPLATAVIEDLGQAVRHYSFLEIKDLSDRLAQAFSALGVCRGDRVVLSLAQDVESLLTHLACFKLGAISVPIAGLYAGESLAFRINDCEACLLITNRDGADKLMTQPMPSLLHTVVTGGRANATEIDFDNLLQHAPLALPPLDTMANDPAFIFYTSGTTASPKGVLHAHRMVCAHLPCVQLGFEMAPQTGDVFWTPSDWSWLGSLGDLVLPALYLGHPVVVTPERFSAQRAYDIIRKHRVTCPFLATAVLRSMSKSPPTEDTPFPVRAIMTGGEAMPPEVRRWAQAVFGAPVNDEFGLTESNQLAVACTRLFATPEGSVGRLAPGKKVRIIDAEGNEQAPGQPGEIAIWHDSPGNMLGYWNNPALTTARFIGGWLRSGDRGALDELGYLYYFGRLDDMILVNGLRVSPEEVEASLLMHPAVAEVAVIGVPAETSGESIVAVVRLQHGVEGTTLLADELKESVKHHLAAHAYPRTVLYMDDIPTTSTGKIQRGALKARIIGERGELAAQA